MADTNIMSITVKKRRHIVWKSLINSRYVKTCFCIWNVLLQRKIMCKIANGWYLFLHEYNWTASIMHYHMWIKSSIFSSCSALYSNIIFWTPGLQMVQFAPKLFQDSQHIFRHQCQICGSSSHPKHEWPCYQQATLLQQVQNAIPVSSQQHMAKCLSIPPP